MASATNDASASASLSSADNPPDNSTAVIEQLSEELGIRQAVLASLRDLPESATTKQEIAAARASIVDLKRQLSEARGRVPSTSANMNNGHGSGGFRGYTVVFQQFKFDGLQPRRGIWFGFRHSDEETLYRELTPRRWSVKRGRRQVETGEPELRGFRR
ncbi:hypothetical protein NEMBOFW57_001858 [Staphylotrichum longicolle]|uniref:Uncharacterized protein n=1 Tax=Staphylotrichum longicolle TaxID=669026 RepID=A0AAD4F295_9PEZI|nr:hypothetical protein NEMBOFW57_001858 [Staphylotrichum longicolle]